MHGFTNFQQSKAMYEHGYRHPDSILEVDKWDSYYLTTMPIDIQVEVFPSFSLADLVTMQGILYNKTQAPVAEIIQSYVDSALHEGDTLVQQSNQRLKEAYQ
jgi:hypothetical protein